MNYEEFIVMNEQGRDHWWYNLRKILMEHELVNNLSDLNNLRILDLASACGDNFEICSKYGKTFALDISWNAITFCTQKNIYTIVQSDAQVLPFKSDQFDIVIALDVLEHLEDDTGSLREINRVLKKNGKLIFNVPALQSLFSYHDTAFHHLRRYSINEIKQKLDNANLEIGFVTYWSFFIFPLVFFMRKIYNRLISSNNDTLSDFHLAVPVAVEKIFHTLGSIEIFLIKRKTVFPIGVSLFGSASKS